MKTLVFGVLLCVSLFGYQVCMGAKPTDSKPVELLETQQIDFGLLSPENGICTMLSGGALVGSQGQSCSGAGIPGEIQITGESNQVVGISFIPGTQDGITFRPQVDGPSSIILKGKKSITIIGELEFSNAQEGSFSIQYTLSANYE